MVEIPASVNKISHNALVFAVTGEDKAQHNEQRITLHFEGGIDQVAQGLDIGFTNCEFTFGDSVTVYHLSDDGTQILDEANEVVETLESQYPVTDFDIRIVGVDSEDVLSVALDQIGTNHVYQFVACNFKSGENNFASDTTVTWRAEQKVGESYQVIDCINAQGEFTVTGIGEFRVTATSNDTNTVTATFTVRVNSVVSAVVGLQQGETTETVAFDSEYTADFTIMSDGKNSPVVTFHITSVLSFNDFPCNDDYTITVESGNATVNGDIVTLPMSGSATLRLTFTAYPEVYRVFNFEVISKVFDYDPNAEFYRFGTVNEVPIKYVEGVDTSKFTITGVPFTVQNVDASVDANHEKTALQFSGGGKITVQAKAGDIVLDSFVVQVIPDAINIFNSEQVFSSSATMCLTEDITRSTGSITVGKGCYLYGNGYTITATEGAYKSQNSYLVKLDGTLDNVRIIGLDVDNFYMSNGEHPYQTCATVHITTSGAEIHNSYLANGKFTVRFMNMAGEATISNTTLVGGAVSLGCDSNAGTFNLNLHDVKIVQFQREVTGSEGNKVNMVGASFAFLGSNPHTTVVNYSGENNTLQCFVTESMIEFLPSDYRAIASELWSNTDFSKHKFTYNNTAYLHAGILALLDEEGKYPTFNFANDCNLKDKMNGTPVSAYGNYGYVYAFDGSNNSVNTYVQNNIASWLTTIPAQEFTYQPLKAQVTISDVQLSGDVTDTPTVNLSDAITGKVTATKYGQNLEVKIAITKVSGDGTFDNQYNFTGVGEYTITYTVVDKFEIVNSKPLEEIYTFALYVTRGISAPIIELTNAPNGIDQTMRSNAKLGTVSIVDGEKIYTDNATMTSNFYNSLADVEYSAQATLKENGFEIFGMKLGEFDPLYKLNIKEFFGVKLYYIDENNVKQEISEQEIPESNKVEITVEWKYHGDETYDKTIEYNSADAKFASSDVDAPGNSLSKQARYSNAFDVKISVTYRGKTSSIETSVAFWVPKLTEGNFLGYQLARWGGSAKI